MLQKTCVQHVFCLFFLQCFLIHEQGTSHHLHTRSHDHSHTHSLTRQWRHAGVWSRKPSGWRKWRSPPSSLPLTLLINITQAYLRNSHHKVTSCLGFNKLSLVRISEIRFFCFHTALAPSDALQAAYFQLQLYAPAVAPWGGGLLSPLTGPLQSGSPSVQGPCISETSIVSYNVQSYVLIWVCLSEIYSVKLDDSGHWLADLIAAKDLKESATGNECDRFCQWG